MRIAKQAEKQGHDVYALYKTAKVQQRDCRKGQGQSKEKREGQIAAKACSERRACHQRGDWEGDAICPKFNPT